MDTMAIVQRIGELGAAVAGLRATVEGLRSASATRTVESFDRFVALEARVDEAGWQIRLERIPEPAREVVEELGAGWRIERTPGAQEIGRDGCLAPGGPDGGQRKVNGACADGHGHVWPRSGGTAIQWDLARCVKCGCAYPGWD